MSANPFCSRVDRLRALLWNPVPDPGQPEGEHEAWICSVCEAVADLAALPARDLDEMVHKARALGDLGDLIPHADAKTRHWTSRLAASLIADMKTLPD